MYNVNNEACLPNQCCRGKAITITCSQSVCVLALVIQHAKHMRRIISFVISLDIPYFSALSNKRYNFRNKNLLNLKCVFRFSLQIWPKFFSL
jgi:hypothetical protein